jgi:hypothetical protein
MVAMRYLAMRAGIGCIALRRGNRGGLRYYVGPLADLAQIMAEAAP